MHFHDHCNSSIMEVLNRYGLLLVITILCFSVQCHETQINKKNNYLKLDSVDLSINRDLKSFLELKNSKVAEIFISTYLKNNSTDTIFIITENTKNTSSTALGYLLVNQRYKTYKEESDVVGFFFKERIDTLLPDSIHHYSFPILYIPDSETYFELCYIRFAISFKLPTTSSLYSRKPMNGESDNGFLRSAFNTRGFYQDFIFEINYNSAEIRYVDKQYEELKLFLNKQMYLKLN